MRVPARRLGAIVTLAVAAGACGSSAPTPPPAEPHTAFAPLEVKLKGDPDWLAAGFGSVWLKHPEGIVDRIDAVTAKPVAQVEIHVARTEACDGIVAGVDAIWSCDRGDVVRIDPITNAVVGRVAAGRIPTQGHLARAGQQLWLLTGNGDRLVGMHEDDGSLADPIPLPAACNDVAATNEIVYVVCERADRVLRVDPATRSVTAEVALDGPTWVSAAPSGVWVSGAADLLRVDPVSLATQVTIKDRATGSLGSILADDGGVWVRKIDPFVERIDPSGRIVRVISAPYASGGDLLAEGGHLWTTDFDARLVIRLDVPPDR
jgi:hypothetical protein